MKNKILNIELIIFGISILAFLLIGGEELWKSGATDIFLAISTSLSVGIIYELFVRKNQRDETLEIANLSKELVYSGIKEYKPEFRDFLPDFKIRLKKASTIDMYLTYGLTLFTNISSDLAEIFKKRNVDINIFILSPDNPFLASYSNLWKIIDETYNLEGLKRKIAESISLLNRLATKAYEENQHANIKIHILNYNPINFSFYRFDDLIVFCPTKLTERKESPAMTIICKKSNQNDVYNWIINELEHIKRDPKATTIVFPNE